MPTEKKLTGYPSIDKPWLKYYSKEAINALLPECTIYENLWENNKDHLDDIALIYFGKKITYGEMFENIDKAAKAFSAIGVKKGDIVTFAVLACPETIFSFYALNKIGAVANMVNVLSSASDFKKYINEVNSKVFVCWNVFYKTATEMIKETSAKKVVVIEPTNYLPPIKKFLLNLKKKPTVKYSDSVINWNSFINNGNNVNLPSITFQPNDICVMAHTGGTTGEPKGVLLTNESVNSVAVQYDKTCPHKRQEVLLDLIVPFVIYGIGTNIHMPLCLGLTVALIPFFKPEQIPDFFIHYKPNIVASIPSYWTPLLQSRKMRKADLSNLRLAAAGGDGMTLEIEKKMNEFFKEHNSNAVMINGYGMTELCSTATTNYNFAHKENSIGIPMPFNLVKIVEQDTCKELKYGEIGEICIYSPYPMRGYYNNDEATKEILKMHNDGKCWVHSGDLGYVDDDGFVFITGRIKRIILTSYTEIPSKIFPDQIEKVIMTHPAVFQCCVVSDPHPKYRFVTKAYIVLYEEYCERADDIRTEIEQLCKRNLPDYSIPFSYCFKKALPLTAVGKVDYRALEKEAENL